MTRSRGSVIPRVLVAVAGLGLAADRQGANPALGCRGTHEWVDVGELNATAVAGKVEVRYPGGDSAALPETTVIVARVQPFIQAYVAQTDANGEFTIPRVPEGRWRVNVCKAGFKTLDAGLTVSGTGAHRPLRFTTELDW